MSEVIFKDFLVHYLCFVKNVVLIMASLIILTKPLWPVVDYVVNYDYIVNVLCENKDKPEMECNGKCHLGKELAKEAGKDDKNPLSGKTSKYEIPQIIISDSVSEYEFSTTTETANPEEDGYKSILHTSLFVTDILQPPRLG